MDFRSLYMINMVSLAGLEPALSSLGPKRPSFGPQGHYFGDLILETSILYRVK